jgi:hypothetical protein
MLDDEKAVGTICELRMNFYLLTGNREELLVSYVKVFMELDWLISVRMRASSALMLAPSVCATMT